MAPQSVGDFGVLHRATVRKVETIGGVDLLYVECPAIAPGQDYGPLTTLVPDLATGEVVLVACLGSGISDVVVLERWSPRWPSITEVPGLSNTIASLATDADLDLLTERVDRHHSDLAARAQELDELDRSLGYVRSKLEEIPEAFQRARSDTDTVERAWRTATFGGPTRTRAPSARLMFTGQATTLNQGVDWVFGGGFVNDPSVDSGDGMVSISSDSGNPRVITVPVAGEYLVSGYVRCRLNTAGQYLNLVVLRNGLSPRTNNIVALDEATAGSVNNISVQFAKPVRLAANDTLMATFAVLGGTNFVLLGPELPAATHYFGARWIGP